MNAPVVGYQGGTAYRTVNQEKNVTKHNSATVLSSGSPSRLSSAFQKACRNAEVSTSRAAVVCVTSRRIDAREL
jgi:hypothetical protein